MKDKFSHWLNDHAPVSEISIDDPVMTIGEASRITGLSKSALRKYEANGLIIFHRTQTNRRLVSLEDLERIRMIQVLVKQKGLNLEGILRLWALIPCWELKMCTNTERKQCSALSDPIRPCWIHYRNAGCAIMTKCAECNIYRFSAYCTDDIKSLYLDRFFTNGELRLTKWLVQALSKRFVWVDISDPT